MLVEPQPRKHIFFYIMEIWKDIKGYEGIYQVSNLGNVKNIKYERKKNLSPAKTRYGYLKVVLCKKGVNKSKIVHKLVAIAFLNHKPCGWELVVNHKDFNKLNNKLENLEIVTNRENTNRKHLKSTSKYTGVSWSKVYNKWVTSIHYDGKPHILGYFIDEYEAHLAYENKLIEINNKKNLFL